MALLIWLNENVGFHPSFSRHDRVQNYKNGLATAKKQGIALGRQEGIDRLIIVQAISDRTPLVSSDRKFYKYDV